MKLISCTEFVIKTNEELNSNILNYNVSFYYKKVNNYADFLKQPLQLGFFIPCDEYGNVLEESKISCASCKSCTCSEEYQIKFEQAKERVIFNDCKLLDDRDNCWIVNGNGYNFKLYKSRTIEDLIPYNLSLTTNAIKKYTL